MPERRLVPYPRHTHHSLLKPSRPRPRRRRGRQRRPTRQRARTQIAQLFFRLRCLCVRRDMERVRIRGRAPCVQRRGRVHSIIVETRDVLRLNLGRAALAFVRRVDGGGRLCGWIHDRRRRTCRLNAICGALLISWCQKRIVHERRVGILPTQC